MFLRKLRDRHSLLQRIKKREKSALKSGQTLFLWVQPMNTHSYKQSSLKRTDTLKKEIPPDLPSFIKVKRCLQEASVPYLVPFIKVKRCLHEVSVPYLVSLIWLLR